MVMLKCNYVKALNLYCKYKTGMCQVCIFHLKFSETDPRWPLSICFHYVPLTHNRQPPRCTHRTANRT